MAYYETPTIKEIVMIPLIAPAAQEMFDAHRREMTAMKNKQTRLDKIDRRVRLALNLGIITTGTVKIVCDKTAK